MKKLGKRRSRKIRNLVVLFSLTSVFLSVSTYAWFIGMRTVNVSSFDVQIATTDSLLLSLNGLEWNNTANISKSTLAEVSYEGNTNTWGGRGLIPMSSVGDIDTTASRLKLFEKAGLTASAGGYRLLASRVDNYSVGKLEQDGYVAFDLFIKNFSGTQYIKDLNKADEEAIYLTTDSQVTVATDGVANTGIENSVRVAFAEIGRVAGTTTDQATITGITCTGSESVTGICTTAQIWEPNDTKHIANAISWYNTSCKQRLNADNYSTEPSTCGVISDDTAYPTYAIASAIASSDKVDVYDGLEYNKYAASTLVKAYPYYTDTKKIQTGTDREEFITLAPNSITKVRVYIYIEGQDIDNYDFASIGKQIAVKFGFTKERFTENDIKYNGPDLAAPVITINGENPVVVALGSEYTDAGATATDNVDGVKEGTTAPTVVTSGTVDTGTAGTYTITYTATDTAKNVSTATRTVIVR